MALLSPAPSGDRYPSMSALQAELPAAGNYSLYCESSRGSKVTLFAPHGGCIEPGTDRIVVELAGSEFDYFLFRGIRRTECFRTLHVTSAHYDEPSCLALARRSAIAVAIHGCDGAEEFLEVGGANGAVAEALRAALAEGGYRVRTPAPGRPGVDAANFINRSSAGGVQVELSAGFRAMLFPGFPRTDQRHPVAFPAFLSTFRRWLVPAEASCGLLPRG
jgi:phage replication-related protein YjqB (UPF0714/DUF867 family)